MRVLWQIIFGIFTWIWRVLNFIREFILNVLGILIITVVAAIWLQINNNKTPYEVQNGALKIDLNGVVIDKHSIKNKFSRIGRQFLNSNHYYHLQENSLFEIVKAIRQAKTDKKISGIVLELNNFSGTDQSSLQYIGKALREFRDTGKPIYARGESYTQSQYYLASFANKIYISPQGAVNLHGFATNNIYYKSFLDKLKVNSHVFRVGTYKSAVEPLLRNDMSPAARDADKLWINTLWKNYINTLAENRQITALQVFPSTQNFLNAMMKVDGDSAQYAKDNKLVDEIAIPSKVDKQLAKVFGWDKYSQEYKSISIYDYPLKNIVASNPNIAVILANGTIIDGNQTASSLVSSDILVQEIRNARLDPKIKAIILRVNSPGGSVTASETIREELVAAKDAGKKIVVSMGGIAASGGYWISTPADYIIASPSTLTGSIGIFGVINTIENSLDAIGVHTDGVATSPLADVASTKVLPPEVEQFMNITIKNGYKKFINLVADSRHKTPDQIDYIAQGHVWSGSDAYVNGLVDELGDFDDAIKKAAEISNIKKPKLNWYQDEPQILDIIFSQVNTSMHSVILTLLNIGFPTPMIEIMFNVTKPLDLIENLKDKKNIYALCLTCGNIQ